MKKYLAQQRGSSLLYVVLLLGIMLIVAFSMAVLSVSELRTTNVNQRSQKAFYLAEAGVERSLYELKLDPSASSKSTSPIIVDATTRDSYQYCYGQCSGATPPQINTMTYTLKANDAKDSKKVYLFDPTKLQNGPNVPANERVSFQCTAGCSGLSSEDLIPALEVTIYSFNRATVSSFDVNKLVLSKLGQGIDSPNIDESKITMDTQYFSDMTSYVSSPTAEVSVSNASGDLFMIQLHALNQGATYTLNFSEAFPEDNTLTIQSFGEAKNIGFDGDARRGIQLSYSRTKDSLDIFNYTLFENTSIDKFAK